MRCFRAAPTIAGIPVRQDVPFARSPCLFRIGVRGVVSCGEMRRMAKLASLRGKLCRRGEDSAAQSDDSAEKKTGASDVPRTVVAN